jgi:hypothetical protein
MELRIEREFFPNSSRPSRLSGKTLKNDARDKPGEQQGIAAVLASKPNIDRFVVCEPASAFPGATRDGGIGASPLSWGTKLTDGSLINESESFVSPKNPIGGE